MRSGIYTDISNNDYHADKDSYSSSLIKKMNVPALAKHYMSTPQEHKECFRIGSAIHKFILEPKQFFDEFLLGIDTPRRSKDNKREWSDWFSDHGADGQEIVDAPAVTWNGKFEKQTGKHMVKPEEIEEIKLMSNAIANSPSSLALISDGAAESSIYWKDDETGLNLRVRPDYLGKKICDLKSIASADDRSIERAIKGMGYGISAAMYQDGVFQVTESYLDFVFLFIEKSPPFLIREISLGEIEQEYYSSIYRGGVSALSKCLKRGVWDGYKNDLNFKIQYLEPNILAKIDQEPEIY